MYKGQVIGNSIDKIYETYNIKGDREKIFDKLVLLELNIEREDAGVEKIFPNISKEKSRKIADGIYANHKEFRGAINEISHYSNNLIDMLVDGEVISQELGNKLKNRYKIYKWVFRNN